MRTPTTLAALALAAAALTACSSTGTAKPDVAACKTAMEKQFTDAQHTGAQGKRPPQCNGIDDATIKRLASEIITERLGKTLDDITATPTP
jgi:hypothetical protein